MRGLVSYYRTEVPENCALFFLALCHLTPPSSSSPAILIWQSVTRISGGAPIRFNLCGLPNCSPAPVLQDTQTIHPSGPGLSAQICSPRFAARKKLLTLPSGMLWPAARPFIFIRSIGASAPRVVRRLSCAVRCRSRARFPLPPGLVPTGRYLHGGSEASSARHPGWTRCPSHRPAQVPLFSRRPQDPPLLHPRRPPLPLSPPSALLCCPPDSRLRSTAVGPTRAAPLPAAGRPSQQKETVRSLAVETAGRSGPFVDLSPARCLVRVRATPAPATSGCESVNLGRRGLCLQAHPDEHTSIREDP